MLVEIWSDIQCPFCYLGKRKFELALERFDHRDRVSVLWRSYQLNPALRTDPTITTAEYLARHKHIDVQMARQMNDRLARMGKEVGLDYRFDRVVVANTFDAHRTSHFARTKGLQSEAVERLFVAHFSEGRNVADRSILVELGVEIGLDAGELSAALESTAYADDVRADIQEARELGVNGVPFFVFDRQYAVSGAQDESVFLEALQESFAEHSRVG